MPKNGHLRRFELVLGSIDAIFGNGGGGVVLGAMNGSI